MRAIASLLSTFIAAIKQALTGWLAAIVLWCYRKVWVTTAVVFMVVLIAALLLLKTWPGVETGALAALQRMSEMNPVLPTQAFRDTRLLIKLSSQDRLALERANEQLQAHFTEHGLRFWKPVDHAFLSRHELLFMDERQLKQAIERILSTQALVDSQRSPQQTAELMHVLWRAIDKVVDGDGIEIHATIIQLSNAIDAAIQKRDYHFDWHDIVLGANDDLARAEYFAFKLDRRRVRSIHDNLAKLSLPQGVSLAFIGLAALDIESDLHSEDGGAAYGGFFVFGLLIGFALLLWTLLNRPRWLVFSLVSNGVLALGLLALSAALFRSIGPYQILMGGFLLLVNTWLSAQLWWRYREYRGQGQDNILALEGSVRDNTAVVLVSCITLVVMFSSFAVTQVAAYLLMGILALAGVGLILLLTMGLFAIFCHWLPEPPRLRKRAKYRQFLIAVVGLPFRFEALFRWSSYLLPLLVLALFAVPAYQYDALLLWQDSPEKQGFNQAIGDPVVNPWSVDIWAGSFQQGLVTEQALFTIGEVDDVKWLGDWIPDAQALKRKRLSGIAMLAGLEDDYFPEVAAEHAGRGMSESLLALRSRLGRLTILEEEQPQMVATAKHLIEAIGSLLSLMKRPSNFHRVGDDPVSRLDAIVRQGSVDLRAGLLAALRPEPVSVASLPAQMRAYWQDTKGRVRLRVVPVGDMTKVEERQQYVRSLAASGVVMHYREIQWAAEGPQRMLKSQAVGLPLGWLIAALLIFMLVQRKMLMFLLLLMPLSALCLLAAGMGLTYGWGPLSIIALPAFSVIALSVNLAIVQRSQDSTLIMRDTQTSAAAGASIWLMVCLLGLGLLLDDGDGRLALIAILSAFGLFVFTYVMPSLYLSPRYRAGDKTPETGRA